jgi:hypothetical protein
MAKKENDSESEHGSGTSRSYLWRIPLFYVALGIVVVVAVTQLPQSTLDIVENRGLEGALNDEITQTFGGTQELDGSPMQEDSLPENPVESGLLALFSLLGALVIMIPVAWSYIFIKRRSGYDESVVHTLLILPIAVTGIVMIVATSLALAFSLAGIVAAVRFRTTLQDTKDAVYVFLAIGVGLAAGVQQLGVALVLSIVFNVVNLTLWKMNFGNIYADQFHRTGGLTLGDAVAGPGSAESAVSIGDARLMAALSPKELKDVAERLSRMKTYLHAESDSKKDRKQYCVLMVSTAKVGNAQAVVEPLLERTSDRWRLAEIAPGKDEVSILEYLVRLKEEVSTGALLDAVREAGGEDVKAAEIRSLEGLAKKDS